MCVEEFLMKILMISSDNNPTSGAFLSEVKLCQNLIQNFNHEVLVVLPKAGNGSALLDEAQIPYIIVKSYDWVISLSEKKGIKFFVKKWMKQLINKRATHKIAMIVYKMKFDIIHINTTYAYVGAKAALKADIPFIWHIREYLEEGQARTIWNRTKGNQLIERANRVICISSSIWLKYLPVLTKAKMSIIPNGIDVDSFYRPKHRIFENNFITMIYGGGYSVRKGVYDLIKACSIIKKSGFKNFKLLCVGEPTKKFKDYVVSLHLEKQVVFLGYQKTPITWYEQADIAFNCSVFEGFGRTTVEGMLAGALIIASDTGGTLDIVRPDITGLLYKQGNALHLAEKIQYAILHPEEMQKIADKGREYALQNFSAFRNAKMVNEVYMDVISETRIMR